MDPSWVRITTNLCFFYSFGSSRGLTVISDCYKVHRGVVRTKKWGKNHISKGKGIFKDLPEN